MVSLDEEQRAILRALVAHEAQGLHAECRKMELNPLLFEHVRDDYLELKRQIAKLEVIFIQLCK